MDALDRQRDNERAMLQASVQLAEVRAAKAREKGSEDSTAYGSRLIRVTVLPLSERIAGWLAEASSGKAGRRHASHPYIAALPTDVVALVACRTVLSTISGRTSFLDLCREIGSRLEIEARMTDWATADPEHYETTMRKVAQSGSPTYRKVVASVMANRAGHAWDEWDRMTIHRVGEKLVELFVEATALATIETIRINATTSQIIVKPTEECLRWIEQAREANALLHPMYWPLVCPPKPWEGPKGGGYYTLARALSVLKTRSKGLLEEMRHMDLSEVYAALNAVQDTPWRFNRWAVDLLETCVEQGLEVEGLPRTSPVDVPPRPPEADTDEQVQKEWRRAAAIAHEEESERVSARVSVAQVLSVARRFREEPVIYIAWQMDFRGRMYPLGPVNPQGADWQRALLEAGEGKPITDGRQAGWLAVALANEWGFDKASFDDRVGWVEDREEMILSIAADPLADRRWMEADSPFRFAALCREWANLKEQGYGYVSHALVQLDGTCNGLQHYSAMLRDPIGGAAVNLTPGEKPSDVYAKVAEVLTGKLRLISSHEGEDGRMARLWLALGIDRKMTKRQVMVLPYGGTPQSCREYTRKALRDRLLSTSSPFAHVTESGKESDGVWQASAWLTPHLWEAIGEVVVAARQAMDWLREVAKVVAGEGLPLTWYAPDGLPIQQDYRIGEKKLIETTLFGSLRLQPAMTMATAKVDKRSHTQAVAPNFVHSMDAAMLREYVRLAHANGIRVFSLVHDSFGTLAADVDLMRACLRRSFREMYDGTDRLGELRAHLQAQVPEAKRSLIQPPPQPGELDLSLLEESEYLFA